MIRHGRAGEKRHAVLQRILASKGASKHACRFTALRIGRQSEIRDRIAEGQHYCMAGLKLLAAIIS